MKLKERFPLVTWFLGRSIFYYALTAIIFICSIEFYIWHYLYLQQVHQLFITSAGGNPYSAIRYYEYLIEIGLADADTCQKLAASYIQIGDWKGAADAYRQALKCVSPHSQEYRLILGSYRQNILEKKR